jgi:hypothetical protein
VYSTLAAMWGDRLAPSFDPHATGWYAGDMRSDPLTPVAFSRALELYGPQARPCDFDDCIDGVFRVAGEG